MAGISIVMLVAFYHCLGIHTMCNMAIMWKYDIIHKTGTHITYQNATTGGPRHGHRQHEQKFGEVWPLGFWDV